MNQNTNKPENQVDGSNTNNNNSGRGRGRGRVRGIEVDQARDGRGRASKGSGRQPAVVVGDGGGKDESRNFSEKHTLFRI